MLVDLLPKVSKIANCMAGATLDTADDIAQDMVVAILERAENNPEFWNQTESYQLHAGRYAALGKMREAVFFGKFAYFVGDDENGENPLDLVASNHVLPEDCVIENEEIEALTEAFNQLSGQERKVIALAVSGKKTGEIAKELGCSAAAVTCYKNRAAEKFHKAAL